MTILSNSLMDKVTKLTNQGRLAEATSLLRSMHSGNATQETLGARLASSLSGSASFKPAAPVEHYPGRFEWRTCNGASGTLRYKVYIPSTYGNDPLPVVVMLHGCRQTPDDFAAGTAMNRVAEEKSFLVVYPEQAGAANASRCWNWFRKSDQRRDHGEPDLIAGITRQTCAEFSADTARVYVAGLSAGGAAAANIALLYPDLFAAVGVHSGLALQAASDLPSALAAMRSGGIAGLAKGQRVPAIVFHGDRDNTVNVVNAHQVSQQALEGIDTRMTINKGLADGVSYTQTIHALESGDATLEEWIVHGGTHAWFGGDNRGSYTTRGPDASREMIRFFLEHRLVSDPVAHGSP